MICVKREERPGEVIETRKVREIDSAVTAVSDKGSFNQHPCTFAEIDFDVIDRAGCAPMTLQNMIDRMANIGRAVDQRAVKIEEYGAGQ